MLEPPEVNVSKMDPNQLFLYVITTFSLEVSHENLKKKKFHQGEGTGSKMCSSDKYLYNKVPFI